MRRYFLLASVSVVLACQSRLTGNEGNLTFSYIADDDLLDFNKPVAVGASLDLEVRTVGANRRVTLLQADSGSSVFRVVTFSGSTLTIQATDPGQVLLQVEARTPDGDTVMDSVNMLAARPDVMKFGHTCVDGNQGLYLAGQRILVPFELERTNGQAVIGYGYYPVTLSNPSALTLDRSIKAQQFLHFEAASTPATVSLTADVGNETATVQTVAPSAINGAEVVLGNIQETDVGETNLYYILPTRDGRSICQAQISKTVASDTPDICAVADRNPPANAQNEAGWIAVTGVSAGTCRFTVTYGSGSGASVPLELPIAP